MSGTENLGAWWVPIHEVHGAGERVVVRPGITFYVGRDPGDVVKFSAEEEKVSEIIKLKEELPEGDTLSRYIFKFKMDPNGLIEAAINPNSYNKVNYFIHKESGDWIHPLLGDYFTSVGEDPKIEILMPEYKIKMLGIHDPQYFTDNKIKLLCFYLSL